MMVQDHDVPLSIRVNIKDKETPSQELVDAILQSFLNLKSKSLYIYSAGHVKKNDSDNGVHFFAEGLYKQTAGRNSKSKHDPV